MTVILAGNPEQAAVYAAANGLREYRYIGWRDHGRVRTVCRGIRNCRVLLVGTWWRRKDVISIINELSLRGCILRVVGEIEEG